MANFDDSAYGVAQRASGTSTARWFAAINTSQVATLPNEWGKNGDYWVEVCPRTQNLLYQFSDTSGARVATTTATTAGSGGTTVAGLLLSGVMTQVKVPIGCRYFPYMTESGTSDVYMGLRSDKGSR